MIKAIFFDFDGVLTTDKTGSYTTCKYLYEKTGIEIQKLTSCYSKFKHELNTGKKMHKDIWPELCECIGYKINFKLLQKAFDSTPSNKIMYKLAARLKQNYKTGIITYNKKDRFDYLTKKLSLEKLFDTIIVSADVGSGKQDKKIFYHAVKSIHVKLNECIFIDNQKKNLVVPKKIGIKTIFYNDSDNNVGLLIEKLRSNGINV